MQDPITDMLNRIQNAQKVRHEGVDVSFSKLAQGSAEILERKGFVGKVEAKGKKPRKVIRITLRYNEDKTPRVSGAKRISKSGQRIYRGYAQLTPIKSGKGMAVISTPQGLMTGSEARAKKVGGEVLFHIW